MRDSDDEPRGFRILLMMMRAMLGSDADAGDGTGAMDVTLDPKSMTKAEARLVLELAMRMMDLTLIFLAGKTLAATGGELHAVVSMPLNCRPETMTALLDKMIAMGFVTRVGLLYSLTPDGKRAAKYAEERAKAEIADVVKSGAKG